jgi:hypothetical protein
MRQGNIEHIYVFWNLCLEFKRIRKLRSEKQIFQKNPILDCVFQKVLCLDCRFQNAWISLGGLRNN